MDCIGACCTAGIQLDLNEVNANTLRAGGTLLELMDTEPKLRIKLGTALLEVERVNRYRLLTDCGYLEPHPDPLLGMKICKLFDNSERPEICPSFTAGSRGCRDIRFSRKVDSFDDYVRYIQGLGKKLCPLDAAASQPGASAVSGA